MALSYWPSEKYSTPCALLDAAVAPEETHPAEHKSAVRQHAAAAIDASRVSQALNKPSKGVWLFDDFWINIIPLTHDEQTRLTHGENALTMVLSEPTGGRQNSIPFEFFTRNSGLE